MSKIERGKKLADIVRKCLRPCGLKSNVDETELHVRELLIAVTAVRLGCPEPYWTRFFRTSLHSAHSPERQPLEERESGIFDRDHSRTKERTLTGIGRVLPVQFSRQN